MFISFVGFYKRNTIEKILYDKATPMALQQIG